MPSSTLLRYGPLASALLFACPPALAQDTDNDSPTEEVSTLDAVLVQGKTPMPDSFLQDISSVQMEREAIENYKGTSVGDLVKGLNGVYTGEARNSGALDPNIRGVQGTGRVPVLVDGTEQSTTVWLGAQGGVSNRSYVDPNLVGGISAEKGPSLENGSGLGGTIRIRTLDVDDLLPPDERFAFELKTETATGTVKAPAGLDRFHGKDYRDIPGAYGAGSFANDLGVILPASSGAQALPRRRSGNGGLSLDDASWRVAAAARQEHYDLLAAYSFRRSGNYFSGTRGASKYEKTDWLTHAYFSQRENPNDPSALRDYVANVFQPGQEVLNTHNETESVLLKGALYLPADQTLRLNYMRTEQRYGENAADISTYITMGEYQDERLPVVPDSTLTQQTWKLGYRWDPVDNPWIDLDINLWKTDSRAFRHDNGGVAWALAEGQIDRPYDNYRRCNDFRQSFPEQAEWDDMVCRQWQDKGEMSRTPDANIEGTVIDKSWQLSRHGKTGFNVGNRFRLHPDLSLNVGADLVREDLDESHAMEGQHSFNENVIWRDYMGARSGKRQEYSARFSLDWAITPRLQLTAGARYSRYWSKDEKLAEKRRDQTWARHNKITHSVLSYAMYLTEDQVAQLQHYQSRRDEIDQAARTETLTDEQRAFARESQQWLDALTQGYIARTDADREANSHRVFYGLPGDNNFGRYVTLNGATYLGSYSHGHTQGPLAVMVPTPDLDHRGYADNNPFANGTFDINEKVTDANGVEHYKYLVPGYYDQNTGERTEYRSNASDLLWVQGMTGYVHSSGWLTEELPKDERYPLPDKRSNDAWAPMLGLTWFMTDHSRVYARYAEYVRFPSVFEDFQSAFGLLGSRDDYHLKAERTRNIELGVVQDMTPWFPSLDAFDLRLNYYRNRIENFIDRNDNYMVVQFDEKRLEGLEFLASADGGSWFGGLGVSYRLKNKLCDADYASALDPFFNTRFNTCVTAGFPLTFTRTSLEPDYSITLDGGLRLLERKLELGARAIYHSRASNKDEERWIEAGNFGVITMNQPYRWQPILVVDLYAQYRVNRHLRLNAGINNLTDLYYLDPLARMTQPAPGRSFKLGMTLSF